MTFDSITQDERLWATRYDGCADNVLDDLFEKWNDVVWLRDFFKANFDDLISFFKITDVNDAIYDTIEDSDRLQCLILDISPSLLSGYILYKTSETVSFNTASPRNSSLSYDFVCGKPKS